MNALVRINGVETPWRWVKILHKFRDAGFGRSMMRKKGNSYPEHLFQQQQSATPSMMAVVLRNQVSTRWLVYPLRECYSNWGSVLIFVIGRLDTYQWIQLIRLCKWKSHVADPMHDHPYYHGHFFHEPVGRMGCQTNRQTNVHRISHFTHWIMRLLLALWWAFALETSLYTFSAHLVRSTHIPLPQTFLSPIFL